MRVTDDEILIAWHEAIEFMYSADFNAEERRMLYDFCRAHDYDPIARDAVLVRTDDGRAIIIDSTRAAEGELLRSLDLVGARLWTHARANLGRSDEREQHGCGPDDVLVSLELADDEARCRHTRAAAGYALLGMDADAIGAQMGPIPPLTITRGVGIWRVKEGDGYTAIKNWSPLKAATNRAVRDAVRQRAGNVMVLRDLFHGKPMPTDEALQAAFGEAHVEPVETGPRAKMINPLGRPSDDESLI